jgi:hypothetical protein
MIRATSASGLVFAALCAAGCGEPSIRDMTAADKAKLTRTLRDEAEVCFQTYRQSEFKDLAALECFTERHGRTTELHPSPMACANCYLQYGKGLYLLGVYYWERRKEAMAASSAASSADPPEEVRRLDAKVKDCFRKSLASLESYFSTREGIYPLSYDWASQMAAEVEDYRNAIRYLKLFERSTKLSDRDRSEIGERLKSYRALEERQDRARIRERLE